MKNKKKLKERIAFIEQQIESVETEIMNDDCVLFTSEYHNTINNIGNLLVEKHTLERIIEKTRKNIISKPEDRLRKVEMYKIDEKEVVYEILTLIRPDIDKTRVRRLLEYIINNRTSMVKKYVKDLYSIEVNLDPIKINTKTGTYGI